MRMKATGMEFGFLGACALSTLIVASCGSDGQLGVGTGTPGQPGSKGGSGQIILSTGGTIASAGGTTGIPETPTENVNCGISSSNLTKDASDLLIVLDRSSSMNWDIAKSSTTCNPNSTTCKQRWATTTSALNSVLSSPVAVDINWGLKLYASNDECTVMEEMEVPISGNNAGKVKQAIAIQRPGSRTPTRLAVNAATNYLKNVDDNHTKSILLATDGEPNCAASASGRPGNNTTSDVKGTIAAITAAAAAGFKVYVVGIGPEADNLDEFAQAGGTNHFYAATTPEALATALESIVGQVASCTYSLGKVPPDPNNIGVYLDKKLVPREAVNGWTLAPGNATVIFSGNYCDGIKNATYKNVQVLFGCPGEDIPIIIP
jgi:hypothetical protein